MSIIPLNRLKRRLTEGKLSVGTMIAEFRQTAVVQALLNGGLDWIIIDNEHGVFGPESLGELSRMARLVGVTPVVRVPALTYEQISHALDGGAQGVMLPRVTSAAEVRDAVSMVKYPPVGRRGSALGRGHTEFKGGDVVQMMADSNRETFVIVQIETREAMDHLDEILAVPGVDAALVGPNDLSIALGVAGRMRDPVLEAAIEKVIASCAAHQVHPAIHTNDVTLTGDWARRGIRLVSISSDIGFLQKAAKEAADAIRATQA